MGQPLDHPMCIAVRLEVSTQGQNRFCHRKWIYQSNVFICFAQPTEMEKHCWGIFFLFVVKLGIIYMVD